MKRGSLVLSVCFALVALLVVWAVWLLATGDRDGGRRPMGGLMLIAAVVLGVVAVVSTRRSRDS